MMENARAHPNVKTLSRIIQLVKQVFGEGKGPEPVKDKKQEKQEDSEMKPAKEKKVFS